MANGDGLQTMSSVDIVAFINSSRGPDEAILRHSDFLAKVETEIDDHRNFSSVYSDAKGESRKCYYLPKDESVLMVMSYSKQLRKQVYMAWKAAERASQT